MNQNYLIGDYTNTYKNFQIEVPERYNWAYEVFDKWAQDPLKLAMLWVDKDGKSAVLVFSCSGVITMAKSDTEFDTKTCN